MHLAKMTIVTSKVNHQPYIHPVKDLELETCKKCSKPTMENIS
jgi:hypothetical protein